jgi:predicted amidophosphoribosyltransferase
MWPVRVAGLAPWISTLEEAMLPALCVACDAVLAGGDRGLCGACRSRLVPMSGPCCPRCGVPADNDDEPCLACVATPPPQLGTVIWGVYDGVLRRSVLAFKHGGHDELARTLGRRLSARVELTSWFATITVVASVPSHGLRRWRRGPSAADLLAAEVVKTTRRPRISALRRHGLGRQTGRSRAQRTRLPRGSFSACRGLRGHRVLLVDDVCTTGTTFRRAAETLAGAGADAVFCAAMAHAPAPGRM